MKQFFNYLFYVWSLIHATFHTDSSFISLLRSGCSLEQSIKTVILVSSLVILFLFICSKVGWILFERKKRNIVDRVSRWMMKLTRGNGYMAVVICAGTPLAWGAKEAALLIIQALNLKYGLPLLLFVNAARLLGIGLFIRLFL